MRKIPVRLGVDKGAALSGAENPRYASIAAVKAFFSETVPDSLLEVRPDGRGGLVVIDPLGKGSRKDEAEAAAAADARLAAETEEEESELTEAEIAAAAERSERAQHSASIRGRADRFREKVAAEKAAQQEE